MTYPVNYRPNPADLFNAIQAIPENEISDLSYVARIIPLINQDSINLVQSNRTPLALAIEKNHMTLVVTLLAKGANIQQEFYRDRYTVAHFAATVCKNEEMLHFLVKWNSALFRQPDGDGYPPLFHALFHSEEGFARLVSVAPDLLHVNSERHGPLLYHAVDCARHDPKKAHGMVQTILKVNQTLTTQKLDVNAVNPATAMTAMNRAAELDQGPIIESLIQNDTATFISLVQMRNASEAASDQCTPLFLAAAIGNNNLINSLLDSGENINGKSGPKGQTALQVASQLEFIDTMELLIRRGARVGVKSTEKVTTLAYAVMKNNFLAVQLLLKNKASVTTPNYEYPITTVQLAETNKVDHRIIEMLRTTAGALAKSYRKRQGPVSKKKKKTPPPTEAPSVPPSVIPEQRKRKSTAGEEINNKATAPSDFMPTVLSPLENELISLGVTLPRGKKHKV